MSEKLKEAALARVASDPRWTPSGLEFAQRLEPHELLLLADCGLLATAIPVLNVIAERAPETGRQVSEWIECGLLIHAPVVQSHPEMVEVAMLRVAAEVLPADGPEQRNAALERIAEDLAAMREALEREPLVAALARMPDVGKDSDFARD